MIDKEINVRPIIHRVDNIPTPILNNSELDNGLRTYSLIGGGQPVTKLELVFLAGRPYEEQKLIATACANLFREGTPDHSSAQLAEIIDFYGATVTSTASFDTIKIQLYCLSRHLHKILPYLSEIVQFANFPESELSIFKERAKQKLAIDLAQNEVRAYRRATELYFGADHPYGYNSSVSLYDNLDRDRIVEHHSRLISPQNAYCFVSGQPPEDYLELLNQNFIEWNTLFHPNEVETVRHYPDPINCEVEGNKSQSALRIGRRLFDRTHPDFPGMFVLNTILGGYFGSRLMRNLREEKGITYGVESSLETMRYEGYFTICLETENHLVEKAVDEIHREIRCLQGVHIDQEELNMVKNYLAGYLLSLMDGPLQMMEIIKGNLIRKSNLNFATELLTSIHEVSPQRLKDLATKYLDVGDLTHVIVH